jgi:c-di-AMP phosphodiesterase-like protein
VEEFNMNEKKSNIKDWFTVTRIDIIAMLILVLIIAVIKPAAVIPAVLIIAAAVYTDVIVNNRHKTTVTSMVENVVGNITNITSSVMAQSPFPMCLINSEGKILWRNDKFKALFTAEEYEDREDIYELTGVKFNKLTNEELKDKNIQIMSLNRSFRVQFSEAVIPADNEAQNDAAADESKSVRMLNWMEITANESLKKNYRDERLCIAHIIVDNLDDILTQASDDKKASLPGDIEKELRQCAVRVQGTLLRSTKSRFCLLCDNRSLENMTANKFQILDAVRAIDTGVDIPASLSIGIGAGGKTITQTEEYASAALDLAQGRGGDQAVVKRGLNVEYFGGKLQTVEKRNKGKSRIVALALRRLIDQSPRVFVMGHKLPDMDALGAALGISRMALNRGKTVNIVIDSWKAVDMLYELALEENHDLFISSEYAKQIINKDDLLVVVDTSKPSMAECGELTEMAEKVVVIDHHRRAEEMIQNPTLVHIEPYASSTSELVTEMLQYTSSEKKNLTHVEAEGLLSGIAVDTKNFSIKTGVRTFEAAAWLRRQGANTTTVRQFFQTDMEMFQLKAQIISRAKRIKNDVAMSYCEGVQKNISVLISMAADELLNVRGMKASFVIGENDDGSLRVSARSLGDINVQLIMEKVGGGGNLTTAGARIDGMSVKEAFEMLEKIISESIDEQMEKEKKNQEKQQAKS